jgi:hypothetical protein
MATLDPQRFERFCARHSLDRRAWLLILLFLMDHPEQTWINAALAFAHGQGPAAVAAGRGPLHKVR